MFLILTSCIRAPAGPELEAYGGGHYAKALPGHERPPWNRGRDAPATPKVSAQFAQLPVTNDWWSSLIWEMDGDPYSETMFPHPLTLHADAGGMGLGYPTTPTVEDRSYFYVHSRDLHVGVDGLSAERTTVDSYGDWTVTTRWEDPERRLVLTVGHGLPFVYATDVEGAARVAWDETKGSASFVESLPLPTVTFQVGEHHYAAFGPPGSQWTIADSFALNDLAHADWFSVAVLPDRSPEALQLFASHAAAFVTGSEVTWRYDRGEATVRAEYAVTTEVKASGDGLSDQALMALYRHQWLRTSDDLTTFSYVSPRGEMKLRAGSSFSTASPLGTLLPAPRLTADGATARQLAGLVRIAANAPELFPLGSEGTRDSYWDGLNLGRNTDVVYVADQLGLERPTRTLVEGLKAELEDWFDGQAPLHYAYNDTWKTLVGIPTQYQSSELMNDHHFHYGYPIFAAATVALHDRAWAEARAPFVELLIRDAGNWRRDDPQFPFMRHFDPYAGHSWATGTSWSPWGNNEESSSEDVNFAAAVALWGEVMGKPEIRDAGLFQYAVLVDAIEQYWYDVDDAVFPEGFRHPLAGIVWGAGVQYTTWFSELPAFIHGIQLHPSSVGALWWGRRPHSVRARWEHTTREDGNDPLTLWRDLYWMQMAFVDAAQPVAWLDDERFYAPDFGNSMAHTYHFVHSLAELGELDLSVTADTPFYAVFDKGGRKTHLAFNGGIVPLTVTFSDGTTIVVPPGKVGGE